MKNSCISIIIFVFFSNFNCFFLKQIKKFYFSNIKYKKISIDSFLYERDEKIVSEIMKESFIHIFTKSPLYPYNSKKNINFLIEEQIESFKAISQENNSKTKHNDNYYKIKVALIDEKSVGYISYSKKENFLNFLKKENNKKFSGTICQLGVISNFKGNNCGKILLSYAIDDLFNQTNLNEIKVMTTTEKVYNKFYKSFGFKYFAQAGTGIYSTTYIYKLKKIDWKIIK